MVCKSGVRVLYVVALANFDLAAALADAARGPGTRRREIESRECDNI